MKGNTPASFDEYLLLTPPASREKLIQLYHLVQDVVPEAAPCISYGMPAFRLKKVIVYFAGYARHIGFYPMPATLQHFSSETGVYNTSKGAIQFSLDQPLPVDLIKRMVLYRRDILGQER